MLPVSVQGFRIQHYPVFRNHMLTVSPHNLAMPYFQYYFATTRARAAPFLVGVIFAHHAEGRKRLVTSASTSCCAVSWKCVPFAATAVTSWLVAPLPVPGVVRPRCSSHSQSRVCSRLWSHPHRRVGGDGVVA